MQFHKSLFLRVIILSAAPAVAGAWEHDHERGVDLYRAVDGGVTVSLVCDPNAVYGTTESAVLLEVNNNPDLSGHVTLGFPDGNNFDLELVHGRFGKATANPEAWEALISGFRAHHSATVIVGDTALEVELGDPMPFTCV